ncbi:NAD(P)/FAD-dependent oxidoreductase [Flindersiella endophytica]
MRIVVVGSGIAGASVAYHAVVAGAEVTLIGEPLPGEATAAGAGIVGPWTSEGTDADWYEIAAGGARYYPSLIERLEADGEQALSYRRVGALRLGSSAEELEPLRQRLVERQASTPELGEVSVLTGAEAQALFPPLRPGGAALHISGAARVDGRAMRDALQRSAALHGATFVPGSARLEVDGDRVTGVLVDGVRLDADAIVVAAGAWTPALLEPAGISVDVEPQRGQIVHLGLAGTDTSRWPVVLPGTDHYLLAFDDSRVVVGATREVGSGFDYRVTAVGLAEVLNEALAVAPGLGVATHLETRIGFRPYRPGGRPLIGPVAGVAGLHVVTGFGPTGLTMAPYAGRVLAAALVGSPELDLSPYALTR